MDEKTRKLELPESLRVQQAIEQAAAGLPVAIGNIEESAGRIADALDVLAEYCIRKGKSEGIFTVDEYPDEEPDNGRAA